MIINKWNLFNVMFVWNLKNQMNSECILCECGRYYGRMNRNKHLKTKVHEYNRIE